MQIVDQILKRLDGGPVFNLVSLILAIVGVLASVIFYLRGQRIRIPVFRMRSFNLIREKLVNVPSLRILYNDQPIENLTLTKVAIWNRGREAIRKNDVADSDKLRIEIVDGKLLGARMSKVTASANNFSLCSDLEKGLIYVEFDYFQKNEGALVDVFHTGNTNSYVVVKGTIIGGEELSYFRIDRALTRPLIEKVAGILALTEVKITASWVRSLFHFVVAPITLVLFTPILVPFALAENIMSLFRKPPTDFLQL